MDIPIAVFASYGEVSRSLVVGECGRTRRFRPGFQSSVLENIVTKKEAMGSTYASTTVTIESATVDAQIQ
jgi:hypothetical protein